MVRAPPFTCSKGVGADALTEFSIQCLLLLRVPWAPTSWRHGRRPARKKAERPSTRRRARCTRRSSCDAAFQSCAAAPVGYPYTLGAFAHSTYGFRRLGVTHTQVTPGCDPGDRQRPPGPCKVTGAPEGGRLSESPRDWLGCASVRPRHARMPSRRRQQHCAIRRLGGRLKRRAPLPDFSGGRSLLASPAARTHPHSLIPRPLALSPSQRWRSGGRQGTVVGTKESRAPSTRGRRARYTRGSSCVAAFQSCAVAPVGYPYTLGAFAHSTFSSCSATV